MMETDFKTGFTDSAPNALDVGVQGGRVALRVGWEKNGAADCYEGFLSPEDARDLAKALAAAAAWAEKLTRPAL